MVRRKRWCAVLTGALLSTMAFGVPAAGEPSGPGHDAGSGGPGRVTIGHPDSWFVTTGQPAAAAVTTEVSQYEVRVSLLNRDGAPAVGQFDAVSFMNLDSGDWTHARHGEPVSLPAGEYHAVGLALTPRPGQHEPAAAVLFRHGFEVRASTSISFDARDAQPAGVRVDRADARHAHLTVGSSVGEAASQLGGYRVSLPETYDELYVDGFQEAAPGYQIYLRERLVATDARLVAERPERFELPVWWAPDSSKLDGTMAAELVDAGAGSAADLTGVDVRDKVVLVTPADGFDYGEAARAVAAAGGRAIVLRLLPEVSAGASGPWPTAVPVLYSTRSVADRLTGTTRVQLAGLRNSPYLYELAVPLSGTEDASPRVRDRDLARVDASYPVPAAPVRFAYVAQSTRLGRFSANLGACCEPIALPHRRTEYYSPGPASWIADYNAGAGGGIEYDVHHLAGHTRELTPGERLIETWGAPVLGPAVAGMNGSNPEVPTRWAYREGDTLQVSVPLLADGDGHANWPDIDQVESATGGTTLYHDGELVGSTEQPGNGVFIVPPGPADLRLVTGFHRTERPWWPTSTSVSADWTVRSTGDGVLPLLAVRFRPDADLAGVVGPGRALPVSVERHAGAPAADITELSVAVSYDDGASWRPAVLRRSGEAWVARLPTGKPDGFVSLRARAADAAGNTVEQTIIRAYRVGRS
jgi:hypothetical protein